MEPPSGDDPAARLPHPQCSLWACRAAPSWWGVWSGESRHTTFRGPRGRPASLQAMGRSGRTTAVTGEALGGASGHAPSVNSPLAVRSGRGGPHQREAGEAGNWGIWTRPLIAGETRELNVVSPRGAQWSYRALPSPTRGGGAGLPDTSPWRDPRGAGEARRNGRGLGSSATRQEGGLSFFL